MTVLLLVLIGGAIIVFTRQIRFGTSAQKLARVIDAEGGFDRSNLARDEKGRVTPEAAGAEVDQWFAHVEENPDDWRGWYRLGVALGDAKRPQDSRAAVRRAIGLEHQQRRQSG